MRRINRWLAASLAAKQWREKYLDTGRATDLAKQIYMKLLLLGDNPHPDKVDEILKQEYCKLTIPRCFECNERPDEVVGIGEPAEAVYLCTKCLLKALQLLDE